MADKPKRLEVVHDYIREIGTKKHPTLVQHVVIWKTDRPTRIGCKSIDKTYSLDGKLWFRTAKEAKAFSK